LFFNDPIVRQKEGRKEKEKKKKRKRFVEMD